MKGNGEYTSEDAVYLSNNTLMLSSLSNNRANGVRSELERIRQDILMVIAFYSSSGDGSSSITLVDSVLTKVNEYRSSFYQSQ